MTGGWRSRVMRVPSKSAVKETPKKSLSGPGTRILWNPLRKGRFWYVPKSQLPVSQGCRFFPLKKSLKVAYYKGNIFPGHLIPKKQPVNAEESIIRKFNV